MSKLLSILIFLLLVSACTREDTVTAPGDFTITVTSSSDGSGLVSIDVSATNAKYFEFTFGDVVNEMPLRRPAGITKHTYSKSGSYTIQITANANEKVFITETRTLTIDLFVPIPQSGYSTPANYSGLTLFWSDEFNGNTLNESFWKFEIGDGCPNVCGWGNNELEYYTKENTIVQDGYLIIQARNESLAGKNYTSSRLITKGKISFTYGRVDVRAALPEGQGLWPAIWMLGSNIDAVGWPACGEIDIMEMIGGNGKEKTVYGTAHWDNAGSYASFGGHSDLTQGIFADEFHVFSIEWSAAKIIWYRDDVKYQEIDITPSQLNEFQKDFFLILNVAVGGNWPGNPSSSTAFPQRMIVDYIRVFQ